MNEGREERHAFKRGRPRLAFLGAEHDRKEAEGRMPPYRRLRVRHAREIGALLVEDGDRPFIVRFLLFDARASGSFRNRRASMNPTRREP